ncbi:MAG: DNA gyrase subunit A, partial [Nanoarchaeota archaeon]
MPYQVNKSMMLEAIAELVKEKRIEGISDIRDESNREGIRVVIDLKKGVNSEVVLNQLYKLTSLQSTFGIIMLSLVNGEPKVLNLKNMIEEFVKHRFDVITRRTKFDLDKSEKRAHVLEGLMIALENIDPIVQGIKNSENVEEARNFLMNNFSLTVMQADAILDMRLQRLTSLETKKIREEHIDLLKLIDELRAILQDENKIYNIIKNDTIEVSNEYGDERRTIILDGGEEVITNEDLIEEEDVVITVTNNGYIKQIPLTTYKSQRRGGSGVIGANVKEEDVVEQLFVTSNLNSLLFFTNKGKVHWLKAFQVPEASRYARGANLVNLLKLDEKEKVNVILPTKTFEENKYLFFVTRKGVVKKISLQNFARPRQGGILAIKLREDDEVISVRICESGMKFVLASKKGKAVRFLESDVRDMGRNASGVRGITLIDDEVVGMEIASKMV